MRVAWDYEVPGIEHVDAAATWAGCYVFIAAVVRTRGKALQTPGFGQAAAAFGCERVIAQIDIDYEDGDGTDADDNADDQDADDNADDEGSAGNYCGPWTASAWSPGRGAVTLFVNGAPYGEYQSSYGNRDWAIARCQAVLAGLGQ